MIGGYSIVVAVPHVLRSLLPLNLRFSYPTGQISDQIMIVFDRRPPIEMFELGRRMPRGVPDLPLLFHDVGIWPSKIASLSNHQNSMRH